MKHKVFTVFGEQHCKIVNTNDAKHYSEIREEIHIYEFNTLEEAEAFKKGVDEGVGNNRYQILSKDDVSKIMETI